MVSKSARFFGSSQRLGAERKLMVVDQLDGDSPELVYFVDLLFSHCGCWRRLDFDPLFLKINFGEGDLDQ